MTFWAKTLQVSIHNFNIYKSEMLSYPTLWNFWIRNIQMVKSAQTFQNPENSKISNTFGYKYFRQRILHLFTVSEGTETSGREMGVNR